MTETVVSHHVDALELTCAVPQVALLMKRRTDRLEDRLAVLLRDARRPPQQAVTTGWTWDVAADWEPVLLLPNSVRKRRQYTLTCSAWMMFIAPARSVVPRITVQLRSWYLRSDGGGVLGAFERVTAWAERHLLPLLDGVPPGEQPVWRVARLDLAVDVAGVELASSDLDRFTTRARRRRGFHGAMLREDATTNAHGRQFTGLTFGRRGGPLYCRVYDKTDHAASDDPIREVWAARGWDGRETVWRVEYEVRREFLRDARTADGQRLDTEPGRLLAEQLDALWQHLAGGWLVLHAGEGDRRVERRAVETWWRKLAELDDLDSSVGRPLHKVVRVRRETLDVVPLLRQASGTLAAIGAAHDNARMDELLAALRSHILATDGEAGFARRVARARLKHTRPGRAPAAVVDEEARRLVEGDRGSPSTDVRGEDRRLDAVQDVRSQSCPPRRPTGKPQPLPRADRPAAAGAIPPRPAGRTALAGTT